MEPSDGHIRVQGFKLYYRAFGKPEKGTVLALAGGPFGVHQCILPMADLVQFGYRVVMYDYLGCGRSDRPQGTKFYTQARAVEEVEGVRKVLRLGRVHLLGLSYGGNLALEVALTRPRTLKSIVVSSAYASRALVQSEWNPNLPRAIRETISKYEAKGEVESPKYLSAVDVMYRTLLCRLRIWPYEWNYTMEQLSANQLNHDLPHRLEGWDITDRLPEIKVPCLVTAGRYDLVAPKCARVIHSRIRGSQLVIFKECSHTAIWEDRVRFIEVVRDFLDEVTDNEKKGV